MMKTTARTVALEALVRMEKEEGYSNLVIDHALQASGLDKRDSALATTIFYGVLEKRITLDWLIGQCLRDPGKRMDSLVKAALRCGAYQIFYLDRVPDSAAVNETVTALKSCGKISLSGFVNGVLRNLSRKKAEITLPEGHSSWAESIRYSLPKELILLWKNAYGKEITQKLLTSLQEKPPITVRVNTLKTEPDALKVSFLDVGISCRVMDGPAGCMQLEDCGAPAALPQFQEGLFHVQDLSAQLVCEILSPAPGDTVCDCCAAPGGKTFTMAERMGDEGRVFAFDLHPGRVKLILEDAKRLGISCVTAKAADMSKPIDEKISADKVLCDVPCSGFGVIRRKPEIRYKALQNVKELPELQFAILKNCSSFVKPGGTLVYSTCTLNPAENNEVAERFLRESPDFEPLPVKLSGVRRVVEEPDCQLTMMPFSGASDGFFAASFRRKKSAAVEE